MSNTSSRHPFPNPTARPLSYWLEQVRCDSLVDHGAETALPRNVDCVVVGSGMTGSLAAKHYKETWPGRKVVVLEAREFCSGATGRNAGHCKPDEWRGFAKYEKQFGTEQALKITQNEHDTFEALTSYARENSVDCDLWIGDTYDVPMSPEVAAEARANFERFKAVVNSTDHIKVTHNPEEAARISRLKGAQACYAWPAATMQPRKLTGAIMRSNLANGVTLHTFTPVKSVSRSQEPGLRWSVNTSRGNIACHTVIHATNAYAALTEPFFEDIIHPYPHICNKMLPPLSFSGSKALQNSYGVLLPGSGLVSINPRSTSDGSIMFGGANAAQKAHNRWIDRNPEYCYDDSINNVPAISKEVLSFTEENFKDWYDGKTRVQQEQYSWSGIIGLTDDGVPFVGEIPGKPGQWAAVANNGHGMARIFTTAPGLVKLIEGKSWEETRLPECFQLTAERIERLKKKKTRTDTDIREENALNIRLQESL